MRSGGEFCPVRAKIHHKDHQNQLCNRSSLGKNQQSRSVSSETLSTPHRLLFGHKTHQRQTDCQVWWCTHRLFSHQIGRFHRSFYKLKEKRNDRNFYMVQVGCTWNNYFHSQRPFNCTLWGEWQANRRRKKVTSRYSSFACCRLKNHLRSTSLFLKNQESM